MNSALVLVGDETITLRDVLDGALDLSAAQLVVLCACQTAINDSRTVPDETIGLPAGFLQAGVPAVVGTLWSVADFSTALLMDRFYAFLLNGDPRGGEAVLSPAQALHRAQQWLRTVTAGQLTELAAVQHWLSGLARAVVAQLAFATPESVPFDSP